MLDHVLHFCWSAQDETLVRERETEGERHYCHHKGIQLECIKKTSHSNQGQIYKEGRIVNWPALRFISFCCYLQALWRLVYVCQLSMKTSTKLDLNGWTCVSVFVCRAREWEREPCEGIRFVCRLRNPIYQFSLVIILFYFQDLFDCACVFCHNVRASVNPRRMLNQSCL